MHYDFDLDFNFYTIITFVRLMKSYSAVKLEEVDINKLYLYKELINRPFIKE